MRRFAAFEFDADGDKKPEVYIFSSQVCNSSLRIYKIVPK